MELSTAERCLTTLCMEETYKIGLRGYQELIQLRPEFEEPFSSLFFESLSYADHVTASNYQLDDILFNFCRLLSPYFLLCSSRKCLHWLICAFKMQVHRVDVLMECGLPYYQTGVFNNLLQTMYCKTNTKWEWLHGATKFGGSLSRHCLAQACIKTNWFLSFLCEMVCRSLRTQREFGCVTDGSMKNILSFYCSTIICVLENNHGFDKKKLNSIVRFVLRGIKSSLCDFKAAALMIIGMLSINGNLGNDLGLSVLNLLAEVLKTVWAEEALFCGVVLCTNLLQDLALPEKFILAATHQEDVFRLFIDNANQCSSFQEFIVYFVKCSVEYVIEGRGHIDQSLVIQVVDNINLSSSSASEVIRYCLEKSINGRTMDSIIGHLCAKYKSAYDEVSNLVSSEQKAHLKKPQHFVAPLERNPEGQDDLKRLISLFTAIKEIPDSSLDNLDMHSVLSVVMNTLEGCEPDATLEVLQIMPQVLSFISADKRDMLFQSLVKIISRKKLTKGSNSWRLCVEKAVSVLCSDLYINIFSTHSDTLSCTIVPLMFVSHHGTTHSRNILNTVSSSLLIKKHRALKNLCELIQSDAWSECRSSSGEPIDDMHLSDMNQALMNCLAKGIVSMDSSDFLNFTDTMKSSLMETPVDIHSLMTHVLFVGSLVMAIKDASYQQCMETVNYVLQYLEHHIKSGFTLDVSSVSLDEVLILMVQKHTRSVLKTCHIKYLTWIIDALIMSVPPPAEFSKNLWLETPVATTSGSQNHEMQYHVYLVSLFKLVLKCADGKSALKKIIKFHLAGKGTLLRFLAMIWSSPISPDSLITEALQVDALGIATVYMQSRDTDAAVALTASSCPVIPSLLLPLGNSNRLIRKGSLTCLKALYEASSHSLDQQPLFHFLEALVHSVPELETDSLGISLFVEKYFCQRSSRSISGRTKRIKQTETIKGREVVLESICGCFSSVFCSGYEEPPYHILKQFLEVFRKAEHERKLVMMLSPLKIVIKKIKEKKAIGSGISGVLFDCLRLLVSCYAVSTAPYMSKESEAFETLLDLLSFDNTASLPVSPAVLALRQITPEFYSSLNSSDCQKSLFKCLLDLLLDSKQSRITAYIKTCLQQLPYSSEIIIEELSGLDALASNGGKVTSSHTPSRKRSRKLKDTRPPLTYKRIAAVLEVFRSSQSTISDPLSLVPVLYQILSVCLNADDSSERENVLVTSVEYLQQLVLDILLETYKLILESEGPIPEDIFNLEVLVQTLHASSNVQLQHSILLLLSTVGSLFPLSRIHNIMPVFTFIGQSLSKQDNQLTLGVVKQTISTILPALIKNTPSYSRGKKKSNELDPVVSTVSDVLRVMIDSLPHIPHHRCLPLLAHLLKVVGPADYLHVMLGLLTEKCVVQSSEQKTATDAGADIRFLVSVTESFDFSEQISAVVNLLKYLIDLPKDKPNASYEVRRIPRSQTYLFNIRQHSYKQFRQFRYALVSLLTSVVDIAKSDVKRENVNQDGYCLIVQSIFRQSLEYLGTVIGYKKMASDSLSVRYWEAIAKKVNNLSEKAVGLLPLEEFLNILHTSNLLTTSDKDISLRAMNVFNRLIERSCTKITRAQESDLLSVMSLLEANISSIHTSVIEKQTALYGLKLIISLVGKKSKTLSSLSDTIMKLLQDKSADPFVHSNALLCISELCCHTSVSMIHLLPTIVPLVLSNIDYEVKRRHEFLYLSSLSTLSVIVKHMPTIASFLSDILIKLSVVQAEDQKSDDTATKIEDIRCTVSDSFPPRVLFSVLRKVLTRAQCYTRDSLCPLVGILRAGIARLQKEEMETSLNSIVKVFLLVLEYRSTCGQTSEEDIRDVEERVNTVFCEFAMKLSEISFRPILTKVLQWATEKDLMSVRMISFCHLTKHLSLKFKSLFLLFAGQLVDPFVKIMNSCNLQKMKRNESASLVLEFVLDTLSNCFMYDRQTFVTKETFDVLLEPLICQVCNTSGDYRRKVEDHLTPCISQFAVAAGRDNLWKTLIHNLLLNTRHLDSQVRFASLLIIQQVYLKLGEECTTLLPESIPFLSELMEDDSVEVERQVQTTISTLEEMTGESVKQYF